MTLASGGAEAEAEAVRPPSRESVSGGSGGGGFAGGVISGFSGAKFVAMMRQLFSPLVLWLCYFVSFILCLLYILARV